jgi:hypothetical protein
MKIWPRLVGAAALAALPKGSLAADAAEVTQIRKFLESCGITAEAYPA